MKFHKYHALGNDYLVLDPKNFEDVPSSEAIRRIAIEISELVQMAFWGTIQSGRGERKF